MTLSHCFYTCILNIILTAKVSCIYLEGFYEYDSISGSNNRRMGKFTISYEYFGQFIQHSHYDYKWLHLHGLPCLLSHDNFLLLSLNQKYIFVYVEQFAGPAPLLRLGLDSSFYWKLFPVLNWQG